MNRIRLVVSAFLLILTACAPATPDIPVTGSDEMETPVAENTLASISTSVQQTLTPTSLAPTVVDRTVTAPTGEVAEQISFASGSTTATVTGSLPPSVSDRYVLRAFAGQTVSVELSFSEGRAILVIWGADGTVLLTDHAEVSSFQRVLPTTQDYFIMVKGRPDGNTAYSMTVSIPAMSPGAERIEFAPGSSSATVKGRLDMSGSDEYVLRVGRTNNERGNELFRGTGDSGCLGR
jgi:hypothetical protein